VKLDSFVICFVVKDRVAVFFSFLFICHFFSAFRSFAVVIP